MICLKTNDEEVVVSDDNKWQARAAGERPTTARQQQDSKVRIKIKNIRKTMETLQNQSTPLTRSDEYESGNDEDLEMTQSHWPWVVHGACCLTNMAPNPDGGSEASFVKRPVFHVWVGSAAKGEWTAENIKKAKVKLHTDFDSYYEAFRSESGKNKDPPPRPTKSTVKTVNRGATTVCPA